MLRAREHAEHVRALDEPVALEAERGERVKDKERFKQRMADVEKGVQEIVEDLDKKLHEAEKKVQTLEKEKTQALKEGITSQELCDKYDVLHKATYARVDIAYVPCNRLLVLR